jgi:predicted DNA-binding protein (UPF0251 family)
MARPKKNRKISCKLDVYYFKPRGIPMFELESIVLEKDEVEAIRLADYHSFSQEDAAAEMNISRATFGRIIKSARKNLSKAILEGKAIEIIK